MLTLTFLGVGAAFAKRNWQSNALVEAWRTGPGNQAAPDDVLLIDFGATGPIALHHLKDVAGFEYLGRDGAIWYPAIRRVFVTHLHGDHVGGLEELAFAGRHQARASGLTPPCCQLIGDERLLADLWERSLRGGLSATPGRALTLVDYFVVHGLQGSPAQGWQGFPLLDRYRITPIATDHIQVQTKYDWPSFGLVIEDEETGSSVVYSGDTKFDREAMAAHWDRARLIFQDVELVDYPSVVHARISELRGLPEPVRRKMSLYHYADTWDAGQFRFVAAEFAGFAEAQRRYMLFD